MELMLKNKCNYSKNKNFMAFAENFFTHLRTTVKLQI